MTKAQSEIKLVQSEIKQAQSEFIQVQNEFILAKSFVASDLSGIMLVQLASL